MPRRVRRTCCVHWLRPPSEPWTFSRPGTWREDEFPPWRKWIPMRGDGRRRTSDLWPWVPWPGAASQSGSGSGPALAAPGDAGRARPTVDTSMRRSGVWSGKRGTRRSRRSPAKSRACACVSPSSPISSTKAAAGSAPPSRGPTPPRACSCAAPRTDARPAAGARSGTAPAPRPCRAASRRLSRNRCARRGSRRPRSAGRGRCVRRRPSDSAGVRSGPPSRRPRPAAGTRSGCRLRA